MAEEVKTRPPVAARPAPPRRRRGRSLLWILLVIILAAGLIFFAVKYYQTRNENDKLSDPKSAAQVQTQDLVSKVGKLVVLPSGETPTVATVTDVTKLKNQPFFANAQNGDKVLIYTQSKKAVLYRPSTNKVIEIAPVNLGGTSSGTNGQ